MLAVAGPLWVLRDVFLAMGLGAWLCAGYTLLRLVAGNKRMAVFFCDAVCAFSALVCWRAAAVSIFYAGVPRWYTLCGMAAAFLALRALLAGPAARLRGALRRLAARCGTPLACLAAPLRSKAGRWHGALKACGKAARARMHIHKKHVRLPTKQLQKSARVLYNSK